MFCEYCGEMIRSGAKKCPCCGSKVSPRTNEVHNNIPTSANMTSEQYYANLSTPENSTNNTSLNNTGNSSPLADIVMILLSFFMPILGIVFAVMFFRQKKTFKGLICFFVGFLPILLFILTIVISIMAESMDLIV